MARPKRWVDSKVVHGIGEVRLSSWKYFTDLIYQRMLTRRHYIWRGHRCDNWTLEPTLDRLLSSVKKAHRSDLRDSQLEAFKYAARGRRGSNPPALDENDWWALGQHHGLATPLLDWTHSPYAAAYFAFIKDERNQTDYRAVYALSSAAVRRRIETLKRAAGDRPFTPPVEFIRPMSDDNPRLVHQRGIFTRVRHDASLEETENFEDDRSFILMKILVPNRDRAECLRSLNRMNINHLTLFPDLYGASKFCNLDIEIDSY